MVSHVSFVPLRDPQFSATPVLAPDVIHAQSKDLPRIFRVSAQGRVEPASISLPVLTLPWFLMCLHSVPLPATSLHMLSVHSHHELAMAIWLFPALFTHPWMASQYPRRLSSSTLGHLAMEPADILSPQLESLTPLAIPCSL